ncbi:hypothetical protein BDV93DRAFT_509789 [Ceratobasidium sp. AG-I]|nr:hypothetical protein BDV93DRAFT_509789 [Ceratobasidium sp. AG-I]
MSTNSTKPELGIGGYLNGAYATAIWSTSPNTCVLDFPTYTLNRRIHDLRLLRVASKPMWVSTLYRISAEINCRGEKIENVIGVALKVRLLITAHLSLRTSYMSRLRIVGEDLIGPVFVAPNPRFQPYLDPVVASSPYEHPPAHAQSELPMIQNAHMLDILLVSLSVSVPSLDHTSNSAAVRKLSEEAYLIVRSARWRIGAIVWWAFGMVEVVDDGRWKLVRVQSRGAYNRVIFWRSPMFPGFVGGRQGAYHRRAPA